MDLNIVVLSGRLAAAPEIRVFESGARLGRVLLTVKSEEPRTRTDVIPITMWDPDDQIPSLRRGDALWVNGTVQRRFWDDGSARRSRLEVVAHHVSAHDPVEV